MLASNDLLRTAAPQREDLPIIERAEGVHLYDTDGKKYLDWTSQAGDEKARYAGMTAPSRTHPRPSSIFAANTLG